MEELEKNEGMDTADDMTADTKAENAESTDNMTADSECIGNTGSSDSENLNSEDKASEEASEGEAKKETETSNEEEAIGECEKDKESSETKDESPKPMDEDKCQNSDPGINSDPEPEDGKNQDSGTLDLSAVLDNLAELNGKMDEMNSLFKQRIQRTDFEEKTIDRMHAELQKYKEDMYSQLIRPILMDIIAVRDSIQKMGTVYASKPEEERVIPLKTFLDYTYDLQDILENNNIEIFDSKVGDSVTPLNQKVIKKINTSEEELHGKIAEIYSSGYKYMGRTISPEKVGIYVYQKTEKAEGEN